MSQGYALDNPLVSFLKKPRQEFTREDLIKVIETWEIERLTFHYTAMDGKLKEMRIPVIERSQTESLLADGERIDGSSLFQGLVDPADSDLYVVPVYSTAFINPFASGSLDLLCRCLLSDGKPAPFAPDNLLHRAHQFFTQQTGLELYALGELEFFLLCDPQNALYPTPHQEGYHASAPFLKGGSVLDEMVATIAQITGAVKYAHSEVGTISRVSSHMEELEGKRAEQLEVEFLPTPLEETGDNLVLARWLIRNIAFQHGCLATFAPKLEEGVAGNGLHIHLELRELGENIMTAEPGSLSQQAKKMIGGLCTYAPSLTAFGNTLASSYLRLVPHQEAPTRVCWSDTNRCALIRVPLGWSQTDNLALQVNPQQQTPFQTVADRQTVELRSPDGSALVHVLLAGIAVAAAWGLTSEDSLQIAQELYVAENIFQNEDLLQNLPSLPRSCVESARLLRKERKRYEQHAVFPPSVIDAMAQLLEKEQDEDLSQHLDSLAPDMRFTEMQRVMHRDLHRH